MKKFRIVLLFTAMFHISYSQTATLIGKAYTITGKKINVELFSAVRNPVNQSYDILKEISIDSGNNFKATLKISEPTLYFISYGEESKRIFLEPNDSVIIDFTNTNLTNLNKLSFKPGSQKGLSEVIKYTGNNPYRYNFYDSLFNHVGSLDDEYGEKLPTVADRESLKEKLNAGIQYLNYYSKKYRLDSSFYKSALSEIRGSYLDRLITILFSLPKEKFQAEYFKDVENEDFTYNKMNNSRKYFMAIYSYLTYYLRYDELGKSTKERKLESIYNNCLNKLKDKQVRNFFLTNIVASSLEDHPENFDEILDRYTRDCTNKDYVNSIESLYKEFNKKYINVTLSDIILKSTLLKSLKDSREYPLQNLLSSNKPIVLDFWATWCGPCLMNMPYAIEFEKKYYGKVDFIFVSMDKDEAAWRKVVKEDKLTGRQYLLKDGFKNEFAKFLKLTSVPRYVLIKNGKIKDFRGSSPIVKDAFNKLLNDNL